MKEEQSLEEQINTLALQVGFTKEDLAMLRASDNEELYSLEAMEARWREVPKLSDARLEMHEHMCKEGTIEKFVDRWSKVE